MRKRKDIEELIPRLPKWAQSLIKQLRQDLTYQREKHTRLLHDLSVKTPGKGAMLYPMHRQPEDKCIVMDARDGVEIRYGNKSDEVFRIQLTDQGRLNINHCRSSLTVAPNSSNVVEIIPTDWDGKPLVRKQGS